MTKPPSHHCHTEPQGWRSGSADRFVVGCSPRPLDVTQKAAPDVPPPVPLGSHSPIRRYRLAGSDLSPDSLLDPMHPPSGHFSLNTPGEARVFGKSESSTCFGEPAFKSQHSDCLPFF